MAGEMTKTPTNETMNWAPKALTGMIFPFFHLKENLSSLIGDLSDGAKAQPHLHLGCGPDASYETIIGWKNFDVIVENQSVGHGSALIEGVGIMLAIYYIFNIEYPKDMEKSLTFFQKVILGKHDQCKRIPAVVGLIAKMNTEV